jgi:methylmalonyl-CoA mutase C-terminal domain/subunit
MSEKRIKVLIAKVGLDTHDLGAKFVANILRDAGMEVIYLRPHTTPEEVISVAIQEDVDVLGLSISSGAHLTLCAKLQSLAEKKEITGIPVVVGGVIPKEDVPELNKLGVSEVVMPGTHPDRIIKIIRSTAQDDN